MSDNIGKIVKELSSLSILDVVSLVDALKKEWNISESALSPVAVAAPVSSGNSAEAEKTSFEVVLASAGESKMNVIKEVKNLTGLSLKDAKDLVDGAPKTLKSGATKAEADDLKAKLEAVGAKVELK